MEKKSISILFLLIFSLTLTSAFDFKQVTTFNFPEENDTLTILTGNLTSHNQLNNLTWSSAEHTIDTDININGNSIYNADIINASGNIFADGFIVTNLSSIFFGESSINFTAKMSAYTTTISNRTRTGVSVDSDFGSNTNYNGSSGIAQINYNTGSRASSILFAGNYLFHDIGIMKTTPKHQYKEGSFLYNERGKLRIVNQDNDSLIFGFFDSMVLEDDFSIVTFNNLVSVIEIKNSTYDYLTIFNYKTLFINDVTIDADLNITGDISYNKTGTKIRKTDDQTITNGEVWNNITWNSEDFDFGNMHSTTTNNKTITIIKDGYYLVSYHLKVESNDKTSYNSRILKNGIMLETACDTSVGSKESSLLTLGNTGNIFYLENGDELVLQINHDDGGGTADLQSLDCYFLVYEQL